MGAANTGAIAPETVNSEEIGIKNTLFGNTLMLNAAAWYAEYNNFQANSFVTVNGSVTTNLTNAGRVRTQGVEADFTWLPVDDLRIDGGYAYTYANIVAYNCPSTLPAANLATCVAHNGKPLPFAPKHKLNLAADWLLPFSHDTWFDTHFIPTLTYTSRTNFDIDQSALAQQAGYPLLVPPCASLPRTINMPSR